MAPTKQSSRGIVNKSSGAAGKVSSRRVQQGSSAPDPNSTVCPVAKVFQNINHNNAVWTSVRKYVPPLSLNTGENPVFEIYAGVLTDIDHPIEMNFALADGSISVQEFLPYLLEWIFGSRGTGWVGKFKSKSKEERVNSAMVRIKEQTTIACTRAGKLLGNVAIQDLNVGHLFLCTLEEIYDYAEVRSITLKWPDGNEAIEEDDFDEIERGLQELEVVDLVKEWFRKMNKALKEEFCSKFIRGVMDGKRRLLVTEKEWKAVFKKFIINEHPQNYPNAWTNFSLTKCGNSWLEIQELGIFGYSEPIINDWPSALIKDLADELNISLKQDGVERSVEQIKNLALIEVMENWYAKRNEAEVLTEQFWQSKTKRQLIEIFLASDIRVKAGVHNGDGSVFSILFDAKGIEHCLRSLMREYMLQRQFMEEDEEVEIGCLDDWFLKHWPQHSKQA